MHTMGRRINGLRRAIALAALAMGAFAGVAETAGAQAPVATTKSTVDSSLQGVTGGIAINKFGDVFQASTWEGKVYEFPANGGTPVILFQYGSNANYSGKGLGGVAVDANQNLYITTIYVGGTTQTDSSIYELPYVNGAYPSTFTLNAPVAQCSANSTTVCSWGNYLPTTGYYYQGWDIAFDGSGTGYFVTLFDNNHANDIYACNAACESRSQNATILASNLANPVLSIAADSGGDVFYADGSSSVFEIAAGTTTPVALGTGFSTTVGVAVDQAGNLLVSDSNALYEIPRGSNGSYSAASQVKIAPLAGASSRGYNGGGVAVDLHGNLFAASGYANLFKFTVNQASFAPAATNSGSSTATVTVALNQTAASLSVTPTGAQAGDFSVSANTCAAGGNAGSSCSFTETFTPSGVGLRETTLALADSAGNSTSVSLSGIGQGAGLTVDPGTLTTIGTGFQALSGTAVDGAGNVFVADTSANAVYEFAGGTGTAASVGTGLVAPTGIAVDSAGNLYIADTGGTGSAIGRVVKVTIASGTQTVVATGLGAPQGILIDSTGTLYVADSANKNIFVLPQGQFGESGGATFGAGLSAPSDVAVDTAGNLFIADPQANQVVEISPEGLQTVVGTGFSGPTGVAVDASGSVLVADHGNKRLVRVPNEAGVLNANDEVSIDTSIAGAYALRIAPNGSLVVTDSTAHTLQAVDRTTGAAIFASVNVGTTSAAETVYLSSEGNQPLALSTQLFPAPSGEFALAQATPPCTPGTSLNAGSACELAATFSPSAKGSQTATVAFATNAQNTATPSLTLQGTGLLLATATVALVQTSPTGTPAYGQTLTLTATAAGTAAAGGTPTGTISLVLDGSLQPPVALVNGSATLTVSGLSGGAHTLEADYSGDTNYAASQSAVLTIAVTPSTSTTTLAISADQLSPLSSTSSDAVTFSSTLTPGSSGFFSGTVNFVSGTTVLASAPVSPGPSGTYTASVTATVPVGTYQVVAVYSGNPNYAGSSSPAVPLTIVSTATIVVVPSPGAIATSAAAPGSTLLTVTPYAGFQGAVDFACTGLPANAVCQFNPGTVTLIANAGNGPLSVPPVTTTLTVLVNQAPLTTPTAIWPWGGVVFLFALIRLRGARRSVRNLAGTLAGICLLAGLGLGITGCGSGNSLATPSGTSTVTVVATATPSTPGTPTPTPTSGTAASVSSSFTLSVTVK